MKGIKLLLLFVLLTAFVSADDETIYPPFPHNSFQKGEVLDYKVYFSFINVGRARIKVYPGIYRVNGRKSYKLDIWGKTYGAADWVAQVDDNWGGYVDSVSLLPHMSYRYLSEGNYRKREVVRFDHKTSMIEAKVLNNKTGLFNEPEYYKKSIQEVRDLISGYLFLRSLEYESYNQGDTITVNAFFEDSFYDFKILFDGRDEVKTSAGIFNAVKLKPVMPENKIFDGENAITLWLSDDQNRIPLKADANMIIGHAGIELINFEGVLNDLNIIKERQISDRQKRKLDEAFQK
jgi:hypothetical protein